MFLKSRISPVIFPLFFAIIWWPSFSMAQFQLEKVGSFMVESLYPVEIVDYFPKDKIYLGYINSVEGKRIVIINDKGGIKSDKILEGDGPNKSSVPFNTMSFAEDGTIYLQSFSFIFRYDQNLNIIEKFSYTNSRSIRIYGRMELFSYFQLSNSTSGFSFITNPTNTNSFLPGAENEGKLIEIFQRGIKESYKIAPVTDRVMYSKFDKSLAADLYSISYTVDPIRKKIYLTTRNDSEIIGYNLITKKIDSRIKINHGEFKLLQKNSIAKNDFVSYGRISLGAINHKLYSLDGGKIVLDYIREISLGAYEKNVADNSTYHHFQDPNYHRLILFDGVKQISDDIKFPINGRLMTSLPENKLLFQLIDPNIEEDFIRFGIYRIVDLGKLIL